MKSRNKWITALITVMLSFIITSNFGITQVNAKKDDGELKVAMEANYQPYNWSFNQWQS